MKTRWMVLIVSGWGWLAAPVNGAGITISGPASPPRAWPCSYTVQSNPAGQTLSQINWTYSWSGGSNTYQNNATWLGRMVVNGTLTVSAVVSGELCQASLYITVSPRSWSTSISCAQDNDPNYGDVPTPWADLGCNRDQDSNYVAYVFVPRNGGSSFTSARTLTQVPSGPCVGWWYVSGSSLKCQRETVINKYIKSGGPALGDSNFYGANGSCFSTSADAFVQAVKNHEYRGTPETAKSLGGHQGRIEKAILDEGFDPKRMIEGLTSRDQLTLSVMVDDTISNTEMEVLYIATDEVYMQTWGPNWGGGYGLGVGQHSSWDDYYSRWTDCVNPPDTF